jgi:hypothetical protein
MAMFMASDPLVDFHPLSIRLVAEQLRSRREAEVGVALERLLAEVPIEQEKDKSSTCKFSVDK